MFISSERLEEFQWNFRKDMTYDNIKIHKKTGLHFLTRRYIFRKKHTKGGSNLPPLPAF